MAQDTGYFVSSHRRKSGIVGSVAMKVSRSALLLETSKTDLGSIRQRQCMTATLSTGHRCTRQVFPILNSRKWTCTGQIIPHKFRVFHLSAN